MLHQKNRRNTRACLPAPTPGGGISAAGEPWIFGISTKAPAKEQLSTFLAQHGLTLAKYEPIGNVDKGQPPHGGLVVAVNSPRKRGA